MGFVGFVSGGINFWSQGVWVLPRVILHLEVVLCRLWATSSGGTLLPQAHQHNCAPEVHVTKMYRETDNTHRSVPVWNSLSQKQPSDVCTISSFSCSWVIWHTAWKVQFCQFCYFVFNNLAGKVLRACDMHIIFHNGTARTVGLK